MRKAARAIIIKDDQLLVMHRSKFGHEYDTLVGGAVDVGETTEQALLRELKEEASIEVANPRLVFTEEAGDPFGTQYIYLCDYVSGDPALDPASVEALLNAAGKNLYTPAWLPISQLAGSPFLSKELQQHILEALKDGFSDTPKIIHSSAEISYN